MSYIELRAKSNFTFLTGASHPDELVRQALALNLKGIAITDINGVYGMPKGYQESKGKESFHYISGAELEFFDHPNITVLAQTKSAYGQICRLITQAKKDHEKNLGKLNFEDFTNSKHAQELVVIPRIESKLKIDVLKNTFSNLYLPLTFYLDGKDKKRIKNILELSKSYSIPLVASNDVEYHIKERKLIQDVLVSIREGKTLEQAGFLLNSNGERYLKNHQEMEFLYRDFKDSLKNTLLIGEGCNFSPSELKYRYPSEWIPQSHTAQSYLEELVWKMAPLRYKNQVNDRVKKQLLHELNLIKKLHYADYFLTIYDIVEFANKKDILCQGRGSAANSAVCYVLGITAIDPIQMDLLFERFISVERGEPPDIDIDFEHERREEVIQYIYEKYGRDRAAMVSAVITYQFRSALREVSKAFGLPVGTLSAKKVENKFDSLIENLPHKETLRDKIYTIAHQLKNFPRHLSIHSGGFTLSADPIIDMVPVEPARMDGRTIIQWDKYDLDILGLIKVDVLALGMLSCLQKVLKSLNMKLYEIPHDDKDTYEMIHRGETVGVFQIESRAQMSMLGRLKPNNFYDLVIEVAIVRPGPIVGKMIHPYLRRRRGLEEVDYPNATVKRILGRTLGVPLFQEQVMKLAIELASFTPGEADVLRKCINAWRTNRPIGEMATRLMNGLLKNGMTKKFANLIFEQIQGFSHYGFPESHAASFALLAYASSYLKCHHPAEFACALINSQPMGFYRVDTILYEAIRNDVKVLPVSIFESEWDCTTPEPNTIRLGFKVVNGVAKSHVEDLISERRKENFKSLGDFIKRSKIRKDALERLALAGRFQDFNLNPKDSLWAILEYQNMLRTKTNEQLSFFKDTSYLESEALPQKSFPDLLGFEKIQNEYDAFSLSLSGHPMQELRKTMKLPPMTSKEIKRTKTNSKVIFAGLLLLKQKPPTAKGTCFGTMEDEFGFIDIIVWHNILERHRSVFLNHCFLIIEGVLQRDNSSLSVVVNKITPIWQTPTMEGTPLSIEPDQYFYG